MKTTNIHVNLTKSLLMRHCTSKMNIEQVRSKQDQDFAWANFN